VKHIFDVPLLYLVSIFRVDCSTLGCTNYPNRCLLSQNKQSLNDETLYAALTIRYVPDHKSIPFSEHTKQKKIEKRYLGTHYFDRFPWLTISRFEVFEGTWCLWCSLMKVSNTCGGWSSSGQLVGV